MSCFAKTRSAVPGLATESAKTKTACVVAMRRTLLNRCESGGRSRVEAIDARVGVTGPEAAGEAGEAGEADVMSCEDGGMIATSAGKMSAVTLPRRRGLMLCWPAGVAGAEHQECEHVSRELTSPGA